jgi:diguanylate cyclase (GGDEF)-like protein
MRTLHSGKRHPRHTRYGWEHAAFACLGAWLFALPFLASNLGMPLATLGSGLLLLWCARLFQQRHLAVQAESFTDPLTGLANRRAFEWRMDAELQAVRRQDRPLALLLLDVDLLKLINDRDGHAGGDKALRSVAACIRLVSRGGDLPARLGGDEFAILAPRTSAEEAAVMARRVQDALRALPADGSRPHPLSVSAGISSTEMPTCADAAGLMGMADRALYQAKHGGRDQLEIGVSATHARGRRNPDAHA